MYLLTTQKIVWSGSRYHLPPTPSRTLQRFCGLAVGPHVHGTSGGVDWLRPYWMEASLKGELFPKSHWQFVPQTDEIHPGVSISVTDWTVKPPARDLPNPCSDRWPPRQNRRNRLCVGSMSPSLPEPMFRHQTETPGRRWEGEREAQKGARHTKFNVYPYPRLPQAPDHHLQPNLHPSPTSTPITNHTQTAHTTNSATAPTKRTPLPILRNKCRGILKVAYCNVSRSYITTDAALETAKHMDAVWIGEPHIWKPMNGNPHGCANHPSFRRLTSIGGNTKIVGYLNIRHRKLTKGFINTASTITIVLTRVVGVYLPGKGSIEDLRDDLSSIGSAEKVLALVDFNAHHPSWGRHQTTPGGPR